MGLSTWFFVISTWIMGLSTEKSGIIHTVIGLVVFFSRVCGRF